MSRLPAYAYACNAYILGWAEGVFRRSEIVRVTGVQYEVKERLLRSGESMFFRKEQAYEAFEEAEEILAAACTYRIGPCGCGQRRFRRDRYGECR